MFHYCVNNRLAVSFLRGCNLSTHACAAAALRQARLNIALGPAGSATAGQAPASAAAPPARRRPRCECRTSLRQRSLADLQLHPIAHRSPSQCVSYISAYMHCACACACACVCPTYCPNSCSREWESPRLSIFLLRARSCTDLFCFVCTRNRTVRA